MVSALVGAAFRFVARNSWPVLAVAAAYLAAQFAFDFGQDRLEKALALKDQLKLIAAVQFGVILFQAVLDTVYKAAFWPVAWSRMSGTELTYDTWRRGLGLAPYYLLGYFLAFYMVFVFSLPFGMFPFLIFLTALPYFEITLVIERRPPGAGWKLNVELLRAAFFPAALLSFLRFVCLGLVFYGLFFAEAVPRQWMQAGAYLGQMLCVGVDVAMLALYYYLTRGKAPAGFPELTMEDGGE